MLFNVEKAVLDFCMFFVIFLLTCMLMETSIDTDHPKAIVQSADLVIGMKDWKNLIRLRTPPLKNQICLNLSKLKNKEIPRMTIINTIDSKSIEQIENMWILGDYESPIYFSKVSFIKNRAPLTYSDLFFSKVPGEKVE